MRFEPSLARELDQIACFLFQRHLKVGELNYSSGEVMQLPKRGHGELKRSCVLDAFTQIVSLQHFPLRQVTEESIKEIDLSPHIF